MNHAMEHFHDIPENAGTANAGTENAGTENAGTKNAGTENADCLGMLASLGDETDPLLLRVVDRARRRDGLLPTNQAIESGPLSMAGCATTLFFDGSATDEDFALVRVACEAMRDTGTAAERELAALSLAILEASSIVYRRRLVVSASSREADARLAAASAGLPKAWSRLIHAAMRMPLRASA